MRYLLILFSFLIVTSALAQSHGISYQAILMEETDQELPGIDVPGGILPLKSIEIRFTISLKSGGILYQEKHQHTTDDYGLINVVIGNGNMTGSSPSNFIDIDWDGSPMELKVEIDLLEDGSSFQNFSDQELYFVPYAFHRNISATGTLDVEQETTLGDDLNVSGMTTLDSDLLVANGSPTDLTGSLTVGGAVAFDGDLSLGGNLDVDGVTNLEGILSVNNNSPSFLTGSLGVDGITNLNNDTNITGATDMTGTLSVDGITSLNNVLNVTGANPSVLTGSLSVDGITNLNNALNVTGNSPSNLSGTLGVTGIATLGSALNVTGITTLNNNLNVGGITGLNGQVTINASPGSSQSSYNSYPLRIEGNSQGVAIRLNAGTPGNSNNFITFFNNGGTAVGRIEGETEAELHATPEYQWQEGLVIAETVKAAADVALAFIPMPGVGAIAVATVCVPCVAMAAADAALAATNLALFYEHVDANYGVTYQSGSADYAEWLERLNPNEKIVSGEIVGVYGGKISKFTEDARQFMVISTKPAILGNMPRKGQEDRYEKVAFMGQIPVRVRGFVVVGDYILPSGLNDGTGIAVSPEEISADQFAKIIGVAWSSSYSEGIVSTINMAIGLNSNDVADLTSRQEVRINQLENKLQNLEARFTALEKGVKYIPTPSSNTSPTQNPKMSRYDLIVASMPSELSDEIMTDAFEIIRDRSKSLGINIEDHPGLNKLLNDESYKAEITQKVKEDYKISYQNILKEAKRLDK